MTLYLKRSMNDLTYCRKGMIKIVVMNKWWTYALSCFFLISILTTKLFLKLLIISNEKRMSV